MRILYTGGGTLGSVGPLLTISEKLKDSKALWLGTKNGPEKDIVEKAEIEFKAISSGKLRRYFDLRNVLDFFKLKLGFWQSLFILKKFKPDVIISAGSFVAVPVVWAGWFLKIPCIIHQQDVKVGLANKLMQPFAKKITVALEKNLKDFPRKKVVLVGNPIRTQNSDSKTQEKFKFKNNLPVLLVIGGGTGALAINKLIWESLDELTKFCNIIHLTGRNKNTRIQEYKNNKNYKSFEFLSQAELFPIIQNSDLVISRAGMSALTELAYFSKPSIIIPIPNSHQEKNAEYFAQKNAGIYLKQKELDIFKLVREVKALLENRDKRYELGDKMHKIFCDYSGEKMIKEISQIVSAQNIGI